MRLLPPALVLLALGCVAAGAGAADEASEPAPKPRIYRWVDANGVAHYTTDEDRIPPSLRRRFGLPTQPLERKPIDARAPGVTEEVTPGVTEPVPVAPGASEVEAPSAGVDAWVSEERDAAPAAEEAPQPAAANESAAAALPSVAANAAGDADRLARIELRIAELSAAIAADEDMLSAWIGDREGGDPIEVGANPEFREIATRLPKRIQELEALRRERDALQSSTP
jgi:hypothetical protein